MAEAQLQQFLEKVRQLQAFVALSEADPMVRQALCRCSHHHEVVALARGLGFEIGRRWGEAAAPTGAADNLLAGPCPPPGQEVTRVLARGLGWRLERIHSCQAASPPGFWYDQHEHEWLTVLQGSARLQFAGGGTDHPGGERELGRGDALLIPARQRHRLAASDGDPGCVWLALFWWEDSSA
ncbi:MAG: Nif11 domain/cupin domain-containing protein [Cyanobacteria bacterium J06638_7]